MRCSHVVAIHLLVELGAELDVGDKDGLHPLNAPLPPALAPAPLLPPSLPAAASLCARHRIRSDTVSRV